MTVKSLIFILILFCTPAICNSLEVLTLPFKAELKYERLSKRSDITIIVGTDNAGPKKIAAKPLNLLQQVWEVKNISRTDRLLDEIKTHLYKEGFEVIFECDFRSCGSFNFRFNANIVNEPQMHVDLGDYKFITLKASTSDKINFITYIISKGSNIGYVQLNAYGKNLSKKNNSKTNKGFNDNWIPNFNDLKGSIILQGLRFKTGSSDITDANIKILSSLANYLILNDSEKIILVGHTDASGSLKNNIMLSKERAESVKNLFVAQFNVNPDQIATNGVGFLAPIASNETEKGRDQNRRVEVIIMPTLN